MIDLLFALAAAAQNPSAVSASAQEPAQEPGSVRIFGDWAVGCDNGWACEAQALEPEGEAGTAPLSLFVQRLGGPDQPYRVGFRNYESNEPDRIGLIIDGRHMGWAAGSGEEFHFDPAQTQALVSALARGGSARLEDEEGGWLGNLSLDGSYAALLFIEDRQQRAGSVTAGVAVGEDPESSVPAPPDIPTIRAMPVAARNGETITPLPLDEAEALHEARECDGFGIRRTRNDAFVLSDARDLILISCSDGAYNFSDVAFTRDMEGNVAPARFDRAFAWGENAEIPLLVNAHWSEETGELSTYAKGRGIGDCGTAERFVWDGDMFRLIERREMNQCRGSPYWITVWRANVEWVAP